MLVIDIGRYIRLMCGMQVTGVSIKTNIIAAYTAGKRSAEVEKLKAAAKISPEDGFEVAFNLACSILQSGKVKEAKDHLLLALRIGAASSTLNPLLLCSIFDPIQKAYFKMFRNNTTGLS